MLNKNRFIDSTNFKKEIEKILKIKWWDWEEEKILECVDYLSSPKIDEFIKKTLKNG